MRNWTEVLEAKDRKEGGISASSAAVLHELRPRPLTAPSNRERIHVEFCAL
jgi:hypothetical protein